MTKTMVRMVSSHRSRSFSNCTLSSSWWLSSSSRKCRSTIHHLPNHHHHHHGRRSLCFFSRIKTSSQWRQLRHDDTSGRRRTERGRVDTSNLFLHAWIPLRGAIPTKRALSGSSGDVMHNKEQNDPLLSSLTTTTTTTSRHLSEIAAEVYTRLDTCTPTYPAGITPDLHELPPLVPKRLWNELGQAVKKAENPAACTAIPGHCWISIRCDGHNFNRLTRTLRAAGILEGAGGGDVDVNDNAAGVWSAAFAQIMVTCCQELMDLFRAKCGFTKSDELTILLAPPDVGRPHDNDDDDGQPPPPPKSHRHNGRVQKLCSLAAAKVSVVFNRELAKLCRQQGRANFLEAAEHDALFDCRVGMYGTREEALALLMWRGYDCGINGVSDAVHKCIGSIAGAETIVQKGTFGKLQWLAKHKRLPLPAHQRAGAYYVRFHKIVERVVDVDGNNVRMGQEQREQLVKCLRITEFHIMGNVLNLWKQGKLLLDDEAMVEEFCGANVAGVRENHYPLLWYSKYDSEIGVGRDTTKIGAPS